MQSPFLEFSLSCFCGVVTKYLTETTYRRKDVSWLSFRELSLFLLAWGHGDRNRWKSNYLVRDRKHSEEAIERGQGKI